MKLPNGYGSVIKHKGNRRRPYQARVTVGFTDTGIQKYKTLGWYEKKEDGLAALSEYHNKPYDIDAKKLTFAELYRKWCKERYKGERPKSTYPSEYKHCAMLHDMRFVDIKLTHLQEVIDNSNANFPTRKAIKILLHLLYNYAIKNDIVDKKYSQYIDIGTKEGKTKRKPFTQAEIDKLFANVDKMDYIDTILIMIYTCMRVGELITIEIANVHLDERYMIGGIKTEAGRDRIIPINRKIEPFIRRYYEKNKDKKYLIMNSLGNTMQYSNYRREKWDNIMEKLKMEHTPHDCRHTGASLLDSAGANKLSRKRILGHSAQDLTDDVYTHKTIEELIKTIDLI